MVHQRTCAVGTLTCRWPLTATTSLCGGKLLKLQQPTCLLFLSSSGAMKREQMLSAILEADKDPSKLLELVQKHVSCRKIWKITHLNFDTFKTEHQKWPVWPGRVSSSLVQAPVLSAMGWSEVYDRGVGWESHWETTRGRRWGGHRDWGWKTGVSVWGERERERDSKVNLA